MKMKTALKFFLLSIALTGGVFYLYIIKDIPSIEELKAYKPYPGTEVYADDGVLIGEFKVEKGRDVRLKEIPEHLIGALIATEDVRFYEHRGIDYLAILRAVVKDILSGRLKEGGSTITQQLAKILYLSHEKTLKRKVLEAIIAVKLERGLKKQEILELYLNRAYFGGGANGVGMASRVYFGKSVGEINIKEGAMLVGLLKAPNAYSPFRDINKAEERARVVLMRMEKEGFLRPSERTKAENASLRLTSERDAGEIYGYFLSYVREHLEERYGAEAIYKGGLRVYTTLRRWAQMQGYRALRKGLERADMMTGWRGPVGYVENIDAQKEIKAAVSAEMLSPLRGRLLRATVLRVYGDRAIVKVNGAYGMLSLRDADWARRLYDPADGRVRTINDFDLTKILKAGDIIQVKIKSIKEGVAHLSLGQEPLLEGALIALRPETGYIEAMVGGYDFRRSQFNRAVSARRQPGSVFKPFIYALALERGITPASVIKDEPVSYSLKGGKSWSPVNYDRKYYGPVTLREALVNSLNVSTVRLAESVGIQDVVSFTRRAGFRGEIPEDLSLSLGSLTVSPMDIVTGYTVFANEGRRVKPVAIKRVESSGGKLLEVNHPESVRVISPEAAFLVTSILEDVIRRGTGKGASGLKTSSAGKTGTTDDHRDAWFIGYTPELLSGVWVGNDDAKPIGEGMGGGVVAAPLWYDFMRAVSGDEKKDFKKPENIVKFYVDRTTGLRVLLPSEDTYSEYFIEGTEPEFKTVYSIKRFFKRLLGDG